MQTTTFVVVAFLMGVIMSIYLPMNSSVARYLGSSIAAAVTFFVVALITSVLIFVLSGEYSSIPKIGHVPAYLYLAGFISAFIIVGTTFLIPKIGARTFFIMLLSGQIIMAIIVSHFGILESPRDPVTLKKILGATMVIAGAFLSIG
jgi:transporter family-2 protein